MPHEMARMVVHDNLQLDKAIDAADIFNLRAVSAKDDGIPSHEETRYSNQF